MALAKIGNIIVPEHLVRERDVPRDFMRRLQSAFGKDMHCEWNAKRQRWVIEVCHRHSSVAGSDEMRDGYRQHGHLCERYYAWLVQGDGDEYMPLCDAVIEKLHEKETYRKYGDGEGALERFRVESKNLDEEVKTKQREMVAENIRHSRKENRLEFNKFMTLFKRHDLRPHSK